MAFKIAGSLAFKDAVKKAGAVVLEPMMKVECVCPEDFMGTVIGDLGQEGGKVQGTELRGELQGVQCEVPLSEMFGYATDVRSLTEGRANIYNGVFNLCRCTSKYIRTVEIKRSIIFVF